MFYFVQLFLMPSATSNVLHDLKSPSFIKNVPVKHCTYILVHLKLHKIGMSVVRACSCTEVIQTKLSISGHHQRTSPPHCRLECPFYRSFWLWVMDKCLTASLSSTGNVSLTYMMTSHSRLLKRPIHLTSVNPRISHFPYYHCCH